MTIKIRQSVGLFTVEVQADNNREALDELAFWNDLPDNCPKCNTPVRVFHRTPKDPKTGKPLDYFGLVCIGEPRHESTFGTHFNDQKTQFYKGERSWKLVYGEGNDYADDGYMEESYQERPPDARERSQGRDTHPQPVLGRQQEPVRSQGTFRERAAQELPSELPEITDNWQDFIVQCKDFGLSGKDVRRVIGGAVSQAVQWGEVQGWIEKAPDRSVSALVSQAVTLRDAQK